MPSLKYSLKQKLLSASAKALKVCVRFGDSGTWFLSLHKMCNRATPNEMMIYKIALTLFKLYNKNFNCVEFVHLNFNQIITGRQSKFRTHKNHNNKVGLNALASRFYYLNDLIPLSWLNLSIDSFKVHCKKMFLKCEKV